MARKRDDGSRRRKQRGTPPVSLDRAFLDAIKSFEPPGDADPPSGGGHDDAGEAGGAGAGDGPRLSIRVSEDGMRALLLSLDTGATKPFSGDDLAAALQDQYGIAYGLDTALLKQLAAQASRGPVRGEFLVAEGTSPEPGQDGRIAYLFLGPDQQEPTLPFQQLAESLEQESLDEVLGRNLRARMVTPGEYLATRLPPTQTCVAVPGQELARRHPPTAGKAGRDVYGNPCDHPGSEVHLEAGSFVEQVDDRYVARLYGYVCVLGEVISVLPPVWISPDHMEAHFVHFPETSATDPPDPEWLRQALDAAGVTHGILDAEIENLCSRSTDPGEKTSTLVARGSPPIPGRDSRLQYAMDYEARAGRLRPDGSIDLRERNTAVGVTDGQLLGEVSPATRGQAGHNLRGEELPATDGQEHTFEAGENVRAATEDGLLRFYALIDGIIQVKEDTVQVNPVLQISGNVDYETGNLDLPRDVQISGDVLAGFTVVAGGNVAIGGIVENGAKIRAGGDIVAARGIVGEDTQIVAQGDVEAKFIQNSSVLARGSVIVGTYIFNAKVRAGGQVEVRSGGGQRGGSIVGGEVISTAGISARRIGSTDTDSTIVGLGPAPELMARQQKLQESLAAAGQRLRRLTVLLGIDEPDEAMATSAARRAPAARRPHIQELVDELTSLLRTRQEALDQVAGLDGEIAASLRTGRIRAADTMFAGVHIRAGDAVSAVPEDVNQAVFYLTDTGIRWRPMDATDVSGASAAAASDSRSGDADSAPPG